MIRLFFLLTLLVTIAPAFSVPLPEPISRTSPGLNFSGSGTLHWFGLHVYTASLYVEGGRYSSNSTAALSITYHRTIKSARLLATTSDEWSRLGKGTAAQRRIWGEALAGLWPDVKPGDRLTALRVKQGETRFYFGDTLLGTVPDPAFGSAFFAIWLDAGCRYPAVRDAMLGKTH